MDIFEPEVSMTLNPLYAFRYDRQMERTYSSLIYDGDRVIGARISKKITNIITNNLHFKSDELNCCICLEDKDSTQMNKVGCNHIFCEDCVKTLVVANCPCPLCRTDIKVVTVSASSQVGIWYMKKYEKELI